MKHYSCNIELIIKKKKVYEVAIIHITCGGHATDSLFR